MSAAANGNKKRPCPICGREAAEPYGPFCSSRCADIDLHRWLNERYRVPAREEFDDEDRPSDNGGEGGDKPEGRE